MLPPFGMRLIVRVTPRSNRTLSEVTTEQMWLQRTILVDCEVQRQVLGITLVVLQEDEAVVQLAVQRSKIVEEALLA